MSNVTSWSHIKEFYQEEFGIQDWVVELYANLDILLLSVSGASNESICKFTDISEDEIRNVLEKTFSFSGWKKDLSMNPYKLYGQVNEDRDIFIRECLLQMGLEEATHSYIICKTMKEIEDKIKDEWI